MAEKRTGFPLFFLLGFLFFTEFPLFLLCVCVCVCRGFEILNVYRVIFDLPSFGPFCRLSRAIPIKKEPPLSDTSDANNNSATHTHTHTHTGQQQQKVGKIDAILRVKVISVFFSLRLRSGYYLDARRRRFQFFFQ